MKTRLEKFESQENNLETCPPVITGDSPHARTVPSRLPQDHRGQSPCGDSPLRFDFPMLSRTMNGKPLIYLDNAATTQKPCQVLDRMNEFYRNEYATVRRGVYGISQLATTLCDEARKKCQAFLNATSPSEIIFTKGTTEGINLVAASYGRKVLKRGDEVLLSTIEHHANIVPWQLLCEEVGATLRVIPVNDCGELVMEEYEKLLNAHTKIVAITHISNALGTITPIAEITKRAHNQGAIVVVDGAQAAPHMPIDVQELDCDFYAFSSHKLYGPSGIGVLYGRQELLEIMPPYQSGGDMIETVTFEKTTFAPLPAKFEAGTPAIAEIIGLGAAIDYVKQVGFDRINTHETKLCAAATEALQSIPGIRIIGTAAKKTSLISFAMEGVHPHDIGTILDQDGIAVRAGHHCAQPTMKRFGVSATVRASFSFYNTMEEVHALVEGMHKVRRMFA